MVQTIVQARLDAGVTQGALAARLGKAPSHISRIECGQRRIDALEFYDLALSLGHDPAVFYEQVCHRITQVRAGAS